MAVIGNLARDVIDGGRPRVGGAPYHAARALRLLGGHARIVARCAEADRGTLLPPLVALGVPVAWLAASRTASFELRYSGEERTMHVEDPGEPWTVADAHAIGRTEWIQVGALTERTSRPMCSRCSRAIAGSRSTARRSSAPAATGELTPDADFDPAVLRYATVLKLSESEAETLGGEEAVAALDVPEVLLTLGSRGALLLDEQRPRTRFPCAGSRAATPPARAMPSSPATSGRARRPQTALGRPPRGFDRSAGARGQPVIAYVQTVEGVLELDVEAEEVSATPMRRSPREGVRSSNCRDSSPRRRRARSWSRSSTAARRSLVSGDAGATWREAGGGLPPGFAVAVDPGDPDRMLYAARNRLYLSTDGGRFWRSLAPELPDIEAVAWADES